ncbi:hypothetical protein EW145_g4741 [Phellinidium pouzarii]|uniref:ribonuclease H n=1 Tax=Phellinidium pouzarii TaxID=167371 RepID=A0A4S4L7A1_9AGAM|nr:hypothetical protein EW145_g4741 [Phellinidium pouzarii]
MLNLFPLPAETIPTALGPPWNDHCNPRIHFDIPSGKGDLDFQKWQGEMAETTTNDTNHSHLVMFTDGSTSGPEPLDFKISYSAIEYRIGRPLDHPVVAGDAETSAIEKALESLLDEGSALSLSNSPTSSITIFSDCMPVLPQIQHPTLSPGANTVQNITALLHNITQVHPSICITLAWVPGHSLITGNERADATAKEAATIPPYHHPSLRWIRTLGAFNVQKEWESEALSNGNREHEWGYSRNER